MRQKTAAGIPVTRRSAAERIIRDGIGLQDIQVWYAESQLSGSAEGRGESYRTTRYVKSGVVRITLRDQPHRGSVRTAHQRRLISLRNRFIRLSAADRSGHRRRRSRCGQFRAMWVEDTAERVVRNGRRHKSDRRVAGHRLPRESRGGPRQPVHNSVNGRAKRSPALPGLADSREDRDGSNVAVQNKG